MKIKLIISLVLLFLTFTFCRNRVSDDFPNKIQTTKTDKHVRIEGTKVYAIIPNGFQYIKEMARYQKNDNLFIQFVESNASNFFQGKTTITEQLNGAKNVLWKDVKLNEFEAIYFEGTYPIPNLPDPPLMLVFGDESFVVMMTGVYKIKDIEGKKELQEIMKSIYYDKSLQIDPLELASFKFDQTITNFKYSMTASNMFMFAENGKNDAQNPTANQLIISVAPKTTEENTEKFLYSLLSQFERRGIKLDDKTINKTTINNHTAFVLSTKIDYVGTEGIMYDAALITETKTIYFVGMAYSDIDNYYTKFEKTVETIREK